MNKEETKVENKGVEISKYNALTHGMLRETLTDYEKFDVGSFYEQLRSEYVPRNTLEEMVLERIGVAYIKMKRVAIAEAEYMKETLNPSYKQFENLRFDGDHKGYPIKLKSERMEKLATLYSRYETSAENRFYRAIQQFLELKKVNL